jgi:hypothetical protein
MVTVEVELKEEPEQHLDDGEHIERVVVPISELYEKLQGKFESVSSFSEIMTRGGNRLRLAMSKESGKIVDAR